MAEKTSIEWTDATWNPITGCAVVSPGCTNCYAMRLAGTRLAHHPSRAGLTRDTKAGPVWTGEVRFNREWLDQPLRWRRPRMIFVCAHGDLFAEGVKDAWLYLIFAVMALTPQHTYQVLTKRPERMRAFLKDLEVLWRMEGSAFADTMGTAAAYVANSPCAAGAIEDAFFPLPNVWLGVSAEDQRRADERVPILLDTPAAVRWVSAEPLLGPIRFDRIEEGIDTFGDCGGHPDPKWPLDTCDATWLNALTGRYDAEARSPQGVRLGAIDVGFDPLESGINWVVVGGESGPGARPMHPDWARSIRDQCAEAAVPFLFKQWGTFGPEGLNAERWLCRPDGTSAPDPLPNGIGRFNPDGFNVVYRVGKKRAGRHLDGVLYNDFPGGAKDG